MNAPSRSRRSSSSRLVLAVVLAALLPLPGACSRAHLTATHGRAYHEMFAAQDANPNRKGGKSIHGLDSQEASIIAGNYRKALSPAASANPNSNQLLMVNPNRAGVNDNVQLAPSVPAGN